jgi:hypothetical protein
VSIICVCQKAKEQAGQNCVMTGCVFRTAHQLEVNAVGWASSSHWNGEMYARNFCWSIGRDSCARLRVVTR